MAEKLETPTGYVWLRTDGIVQNANRESREQTLDDAKANVEAIAKIAGGRRRPLLVDTSTPAPMTRECQSYYVSDEAARHVNSCALVVSNWFGRFFGNVMLSRARTDVPVRLFEDEASAVAWLKEFVSKG